MKILITGGAGFIGSHLAEKLLALGEEVFVLDDLSSGSRENIKALLKNAKFYFQKGSILDERLVQKTIKDIDQVYHLAAAVGVKKIVAEPLRTMEVNVRGTEIVLKAALRAGRKKVFLASSSEIYGKNEKMPLFEEADRLLGPTSDPRWIYAASKALDESLGLAYFREKKLPVVIVRFFNIVGPRQSDAYGMVIPSFVKSALLNRPLTVFGRGQQTRCFTHINETVEIITKLMVRKRAEGQIINLGSEREISINELAKKILLITKSRSKIIHIPFKKTYSPSSIFFQKRRPDISKLKRLAEPPQKTIDEIIKDVVKYEQEIL